LGSSTAVTVQIYLSIHRSDLARKELEQAKRWSEDDLLLQHIEATISLVTGADGYADCNSFYTEQLANPSLSSPHLFTARGVTRILLGEVAAAKSDFEEVQTKDAETLAAMVVAEELAPTKGTEKVGEQLWRYVHALTYRHMVCELMYDVLQSACQPASYVPDGVGYTTKVGLV
jgi:coatomer subunit epsilon